ncbi:hypothetical protein HAX54_014173, partial [Datura stramonium]|nr:hypothetical protein [Datura stramonium]
MTGDGGREKSGGVVWVGRLVVGGVSPEKMRVKAAVVGVFWWFVRLFSGVMPETREKGGAVARGGRLGRQD